MTKNLHANHRKRVRARFIKDGDLDSFEPHQVLELLLFYAIPRRDTNELAHKLLNEYGSLYTLMNAKPEDIVKRCKVSETTAVLITMIPYVYRKFLTSGLIKEKKIIDSFDKAYKYFESELTGRPYECFFMLCLDMNKRAKKMLQISEGAVNSTPIYMDRIVSDAILYNSSFVIIGHNHPSGNKKPSNADTEVTMRIRNALEHVGIQVLDHIIICGDDYFSYAKNNFCHLKY